MTWLKYMSHIMRKPIFGGVQPACSATEASKSHEIANIETRDIQSRQRTTKVLIRLRGCAGWSVPLLFAYGIKQVFSWQSSYMTLANTCSNRKDPDQMFLHTRPEFLWTRLGLGNVVLHGGCQTTPIHHVRLMILTSCFVSFFCKIFWCHPIRGEPNRTFLDQKI